VVAAVEKEKRERRDGLVFVALVFAASRLFYLAAGVLLARIVPVGPFQRVTGDVPFGKMNAWSHWDGEHYIALAMVGYLQPPENVSPAFFPLYPLLVRFSAELFGGPILPGALGVWGVLVSLLALPFALYFVYRIVEDGWGTGTARGAVLALAFFPTSFFLHAVYTEALFLALSAGSLWALRVRKDLLLACLLAALATATRNVGLFLLAPLAYEWLRNAREYRWRVAYLALAPSGLLLYAAYLWSRFGDPLLFYTDQQKWGREATGPLQTFRNILQTSAEGAGRLSDGRLLTEPSLAGLANRVESANGLHNLLFLLFAAVVLLVGLRTMPAGLTVYAALLVLAPAFFGTPESPLMGMPRYVLVAFPVFIVLGTLHNNRLLFGAYLAVSIALSLVFTALFVSWRFVA
jgi:hypothetical protein